MNPASPLPRSASAALLVSFLLASGVATAAPGTFTVFDQIPQFGIYVTTPPNYTPPPGVVMQDNGTTYLTRLTAADKAMVGSDVKANITFHAQCDNYDRLGSLFMIVKPVGVPPTSADPHVELVRWITPFSDYWQGQYATHQYPAADLSPFAGLLADKSHDVWIGLQGGSNPYGGDPCDSKGVDADFAAVGFKYSVTLSSTKAVRNRSGHAAAAVPAADYVAVPVTGSADAAAPGAGYAFVIVSGHGSASGGDEYKNTTDTLYVNGVAASTFSTKIDCSSYRKYSPDGNPFIFFNNNGSNPRNWCPGALVPSHAIPVTLGAQNTVSLDMSDERVPDGSYYRTSVTLISK